MNPFVDGKNLRTASKTELKVANNQWADCVVKNFLSDWLNGKNITLNDVC